MFYTLWNMGKWHFVTDWCNWAIHKSRVKKGEKTILACWWREDILMQYTWLKDKNGEEIYEGDIIMGFTFEWKYVETDKVIFEDWRFTIPWWWTHNLYWCEIIWNIYENPDLLT
jgi:hypothetical protein